MDFKKGIFTVTPRKLTIRSKETGKTSNRVARISPRALWDAARRSGFTPTKVVTPKKTYNSQPPAESKSRREKAKPARGTAAPGGEQGTTREENPAAQAG